MALTPPHYIGALSHTWSLATEEQFYLVWPLLLAVLLPRFGERAVLVVAICGSMASAAERLWLWRDGVGEWRVYFGADTHADALLVGCALAVLLRTHGSRRRPVAGLLLLSGTCALSLTTGFTAGVIVPTVVPLMTAGVIACAVDGARALTWRPLRLVGERSYGLYLWHYPVAILVELVVGRAWLPQLVVMVPVAWCLTLVSWHVVERPFLRMKDRPSGPPAPSELRRTADEPAHPRHPCPPGLPDAVSLVSVGRRSRTRAKMRA
jgi:peptidoglycan/LPS O-acetylase OafA/YrhL